MNRWSPTKFLCALVVILVMVALAAPVGAATKPAGSTHGSGAWWDVVPEEENPSPQYDSILYSEIAPKLREIELNSNRVKVDVIGQSAGGRNLFLVTLSAPEAMGRLGQYKAISNTMLKDPEKAQEMIEKFGDFKVPVFINGSIHGTEYPGVDAAIRLIETLAYEDSPEVQAILDNVILLVNVCQNPDGRVMGTRANANGFDINRDFFTQSQPESRITAGIFAEWNPMVVLDLHGFVNPMLIEPCTPPHNPNYEYDLYIKWALAQAEAMEAELFAQTGFAAQIPYRDDDLGWDDWPPSYAPMFAMYHGAYGHTLETPYRDERGVDAQYAAVWGALKFVAANRAAMLHDQIEIFRRGYLDLPQLPVPARAPAGVGPVPRPDAPGLPGGLRHPRRRALPGEPSPACAAGRLPAVQRRAGGQGQPGVQPGRSDVSRRDLRGVDGPAQAWSGERPARGRPGPVGHPWTVLLLAALGVEQSSPVGHAWRTVMDEKMAVKTRSITKADPPRGTVGARQGRRLRVPADQHRRSPGHQRAAGARCRTRSSRGAVRWMPGATSGQARSSCRRIRPRPTSWRTTTPWTSSRSRARPARWWPWSSDGSPSTPTQLLCKR